MTISKFKNIKITNNRYAVIIFIILGVVTVFSITNLIAIIELKKQVTLILDTSNISYPSKKITPVDNASSSLPIYNPETKTYSNIATERFYSSVFLDGTATNMRLDENVTALTFNPVFSFKKEKDCDEMFCDLLASTTVEFKEDQGQIFYYNKKIKLPQDIKDKKIVNFNFSKLETKWIIGLVTIENKREVGYAYLFDGNNLEPLITSDTTQKIKTQYDYTGGSISAGGSDNQFIILYSGFEGLGYLYNNGSWQDLSPYFGLRVTKGGFKARIIKGGYGNLANWYVCSDTIGKPKFIKLWQNDTPNIQGSIDLTSALNSVTAFCAPSGNREIKIAFNDSSSKSSLYNFVDKGFDNTHPYRYQSLNLSDFVDKKIVNVKIDSSIINAPENMYSILASNDLANWQTGVGNNFVFDDVSTSSNFYIKIDFKTREAEYSPWFDGLDLITYLAKETK